MRNGVMLDIASQLERPESVRRVIARLGRAGYSLCLLCLDDAYAYPGVPGIGRAPAWSRDDLRSAAMAAAEHGMEFIPIVPSLGHARYITTKPGYEAFDECHPDAPKGSLRVGEEATYELLDRLYADVCDAAPGAYLHAGLDECPYIGHALARAGRAVDPAHLFANHCRRLQELARKRGRRLVIWGDMLYYFPEAIELLDRDIVVMDWYYYSFDDSPRVELFNFAPVDLTGDLRRAGFTVWTCPSVWPNAPFGDAADRLGNHRGFARYGEARGAEALVNADWRWGVGALDFSELLWLAFARLRPAYAEAELPEALRKTLAEDYGIAAEPAFVDMLLGLGSCHITGMKHRQDMGRGLAALIAGDPETRREREEKAARLSVYRDVLAGAAARRPEGERLLAEFRIAIGLLQAYYRTGAELSAAASECAPDDARQARLRALADDLAAFRRDYDEHYASVLYAGDYRHQFQTWAGRAAEELSAECARLAAAPGRRLFDGRSRVELRALCRYPSMPIMTLEIVAPDGSVAIFKEGMVRFETAYAVPENPSHHRSTLPLSFPGRPREIRCVVADYGEIIVESLTVVNGTERIAYTLSALDGRFAAVRGDGVALGPRGARPGEPTVRKDADRAVFRPSE